MMHCGSLLRADAVAGIGVSIVSTQRAKLEGSLLAEIQGQASNRIEPVSLK